MSFDTRDRKLSRIRRVNPDLAAKAERGDLSVNAAGVLAGTAKPKPPRSASENLRRAWTLANDAQRADFHQYVAKLGLDWPAKVEDLERRLAASIAYVEQLHRKLEAAELRHAQTVAELERVAKAWQPEKRRDIA